MTDWFSHCSLLALRAVNLIRNYVYRKNLLDKIPYRNCFKKELWETNDKVVLNF